MEQEFTTSTGRKIFYSAFAIFMLSGALFFFVIGYTRSGQGVLVLPILLLIFMAGITASQIKRKIIVSTHSVVKIDVLGRKELPTSNIKGFRIGFKVIYVEPLSPSYPKITIKNYYDFTDYEALIKWLKENFKDLNLQS